MSDQALLMDILEAREALEDAEGEDEVDSLRESNRGSSRLTRLAAQALT